MPGLWCLHAHPWHQPTFLLVQVIVDVFLQLDVGRMLGPGQQLAQLALPVMVESPGRHRGSLAWTHMGQDQWAHVGTQQRAWSDPGVMALPVPLTGRPGWWHSAGHTAPQSPARVAAAVGLQALWLAARWLAGAGSH